MARSITISGTTYSLPDQGDPGPWGDDLSDLIEALAEVANTFSGTGDILNTTFTVANNQSSAANVAGLSFDTGTVRSAIVTYSVYRSTTLSEKGEAGFLLLTYMSTAANWVITRYSNDDSGLVFTVTDGGQVQYTSDNMSGASYTGTMRFSAKAYIQ